MPIIGQALSEHMRSRRELGSNTILSKQGVDKITITKIDSTDASHKGLLEEAYKEIFAKVWPDYARPIDGEKAIEPLSGFIETLKGDNKINGNIKPYFFVAQDSAGNPIAMRYALYFEDSQTAAGVYIAVDESARGKGVGSKILDFAEKTIKTDHPEARAIFCEITKAEYGIDEKGNHKEGMPVDERLAFFQNRGFEPSVVDYIQPFSYTDPNGDEMEPHSDIETGASRQYMLIGKPLQEGVNMQKAACDYIESVFEYGTSELEQGDKLIAHSESARDKALHQLCSEHQKFGGERSFTQELGRQIGERKGRGPGE